MLSGKIIRGDGFDWAQGERCQSVIAEAADEEGQLEIVPWGAALMADPGVVACPTCNMAHWAEGEILECAECGQWFGVNGDNHKKRYTSARKELPRFGFDPRLADEPDEAREYLARRARGTLAEGGPCGGNEVQMATRAFALAALWMVVEGCPDEPIEEID